MIEQLSSETADYAIEDSSVNKCIFSHDDTLAICGGEDGSVRVFDIKGN